jgi:uncharacterized protein DUF4252
MRNIKRKLLSLVFLMLVSPLLRAQDFKLPVDVEKLSSTAKETVEVNMDGPMLRWASKFLSAEDADEQKAAKLVANLKSIYVRSFEFDKEDSYSSADVEALRSQFHTPVWSRVVGVRSERDGENVDVYFKLENEKMAGIVIIAAERKELTFVNIVGPIEVDQLADLGGEFGIPRLKTKPSSSNPVAKVEKGDHK